MKVLFTLTFMTDFACKEFKVEDVIKCALNLTKSNLTVMKYFLSENENWVDTESLSKTFNLDIATIQRSVKKLHEKKFGRGHSKTWMVEDIFTDIKLIQELK